MGYECPYCSVLVVGTITLEVVVLRAYESHLDEHMRRGDELPRAQPLRLAS